MADSILTKGKEHLTGNWRVKKVKRLFRSPIMVIQVHCVPNVEVGASDHAYWRDAERHDLLTLNQLAVILKEPQPFPVVEG